MDKFKNKQIIECIEMHEAINFDKKLYGKVHSVFKNVLNLKIKNELITLLNLSFLKAPKSIICKIDDFKKLNIKSGDEFYFYNESLQLNDYIFDLSKSKKYYLDKLPLIMKNEVLKNNIKLIREYYIKNNYFISENLIYQEFEQKLKIIKNALCNNKVYSVKEILSTFFGYGQGLTPTGDDIILGIYMGVKCFKNENVQKILFEVIEENKTKTTDISIQMLQSALENYYRMEYILFLNELDKKNFSLQNLELILNIGHSSGRDILRGILFAYDIIK